MYIFNPNIASPSRNNLRKYILFRLQEVANEQGDINCLTKEFQCAVVEKLMVQSTAACIKKVKSSKPKFFVSNQCCGSKTNFN